jgi:PIN domain nuclease of toxin-antitoxin system
MSAVVADTHAVLWMLLDSPRLSTGARSALQDTVQSGSSIYMAAISLVEIVYLVDKSRLPINALQKLQAALNDPAFGLEVIPLDRDIAEAVAQIPLTMVPDMPDRIIAATALFLKLPLVTRDHKIQAAEIETIW